MTEPTRDNEILRYYEAEMRYLREAGKEFAQAFPDRARELDLDRVGERDPHIERLFEGFAFLMGRLRHKIDGPDETPMIYNIRGAGFVVRETTGRPDAAPMHAPSCDG